MHPSIQHHRDEIAELCRYFRIRSLEIFGSAARGDDFDPMRSDIDFLVEFESAQEPPSLAVFFEVQEKLAQLLGRPVNLVMAGAIRNPFIRADIDRSREAVYAA
jgi:predicted nucleotidyltransferase